jgi:hypothetical protein
VHIEGAELRESGQRARSNRNLRLGSDLRRSPPRNVRCLRISFSNGSRRLLFLSFDALGMPVFSARSFGA